MKVLFSVVALVLVGLVQPASAFDACAEAKALRGEWRFAMTVAHGAKKGATPPVALQLTGEGCALKATLQAVGARAVPAATADVTVEAIGEGGSEREHEVHLAWVVTLRYGAADRQMRFEAIATTDALFGRWRTEGSSWTEEPVAGVLSGARGTRSARARPLACPRICDLEGYVNESNSRFTCLDSCKAHKVSALTEFLPQ